MVRHYLTLKITLLLACFNILSQDLTPDKIFEKVDNSIVVILAYDRAGNIYQGSGVVIDSSGTVVTNHHVCKDANRIEINHYGKEFKNIKVIKYDAIKDILFLKMPENTLPPITLGSSSNLKSGQRVYAVGSPEGYENSISEGIVSGFRTDENKVRLIQMTAPITDGSSGGAVLNSKGELIGLSVSGQHEGSLYFAVPVNDVYDMMESKTVTNITESNTNESNTTEFNANQSVKNEDDPANDFRNGEIAQKNENYQDAEKYYSKYLEKFSNDVSALYGRGYSRFKLKEYKNAISDFSEVIKTGGSTESFFYRGNCYYSLKDYKNAYTDYTKAFDQEPDNADILFNRGYASFKLKQYQDAVNDWEKAIELNSAFQNELSAKIKLAKEELAKNK